MPSRWGDSRFTKLKTFLVATQKVFLFEASTNLSFWICQDPTYFGIIHFSTPEIFRSGLLCYRRNKDFAVLHGPKEERKGRRMVKTK